MKYFCVSDIHSFYTPLKESLDKAGFEVGNENHLLLVLGDVFDRGDETLQVYEYLKSVPNKILIRGNHEQLFIDLLDKPLPDSHDYSNGTVKTFCHIAGINPKKMDVNYWYELKYSSNATINIKSMLYATWAVVVEKVRISEIAKWIKDDSQWVNYYELDKFIFVHSFIPRDYTLSEFGYIDKYYYKSNWRNAWQDDWNDAMWGCPYEVFIEGYFMPEIQKGKVLVCGHWHSFGFREFFEGKHYVKDDDIDFSIFYSKYLIALDTCTALSHKVNVMIIDENLVCYNENKVELKESKILNRYKEKIKLFESGEFKLKQLEEPIIETVSVEQ